MELINTSAKVRGDVSVFGRVGEYTHERNDLCMEIKEFGVITKENNAESKGPLAYGQMNEPPGSCTRVGLVALTMAEYVYVYECVCIYIYVCVCLYIYNILATI
ncbi:unnamed protein product [Coffea canephora]|uniref:H(+)-transporting two-sector ATPase n=1 Tax=Coffea canephora TaxID=49390 RepID=A0A068VCN6_COFCA|nr:unnamed protein product [Coffea canephora]